MRLSLIASHLADEDVSRMSLTDPDADVYTIGFLTPSGGPLREDVLYFGDTTLLANAQLPEAPNLVLYGSGHPGFLELPPATNVIVLSADRDPLTCYNTLQSYFLEDQRQTDIIRRMLMAHFSNKGLQYFVEEAAAALGNPIVVVDVTYRYVAHHLGELEGSNSSLEQVLNGELQNETLVEEVIAYIHNEGIDQQVAQSSKPIIHANGILGANTMTAAVMTHGTCMAHVMMIEYARPFTDSDFLCFERLADFVGQEMQKSEIWNPTAGELGAYFLANLLNDRSPSEAVTLRRMKMLDFHPKRYLQVLCLHAKGEGLSQLQAESVAGQLRPLLHHAIYTRFHQQLVLLVSRDDKDGVGAYGESLIREVNCLNNLTCGISNTFERVVQARAAYDQARRAVSYGERAGGVLDDCGLYHYSDYAYIHALDLVDRKTNLLMLCHPALLALQDYDKTHGGDLMDTLYCYLQVAGSTTRAAKLLTLHKNTLLYRLNRIKQILGTTLSSGEELFQFQMGFRILLYLGLFSPRIVVRREDLKV